MKEQSNEGPSLRTGVLRQQTSASRTSDNQAEMGKDFAPLAAPGKKALDSFSTFVHGYLWSAITFAEQKSAFVFAVDSAFAGYLVSTGLIRNLATKPASTWGWQHSSGLAALCFLGISMAAVLWAVIPRLVGASSGLIYFGSILQRKDAASYSREVADMTDAARADEVLRHCYELAFICRRKYLSIRLAMLAAILGFLLGFVYIALS